MQNVNTLGARLSSAVPYVKRGGRVIDVGTDHAYLPIYLLQNGISARALACDINRGPICSAKENIEKAGLSHLIDTRLTDGLHGTRDFAPDDILIFGMGGELIVRILTEAPWVMDPAVTLILQPMSRAAILRRYLAENGFATVGETITYEDKYYQTLAVRWDGKKRTLSELECLVGEKNIKERPPLLEGFVRHEIGVLGNVILGKSKGVCPDTAYEIKLKAELEELI